MNLPERAAPLRLVTAASGLDDRLGQTPHDPNKDAVRRPSVGRRQKNGSGTVTRCTPLLIDSRPATSVRALSVPLIHHVCPHSDTKVCTSISGRAKAIGRRPSGGRSRGVPGTHFESARVNRLDCDRRAAGPDATLTGGYWGAPPDASDQLPTSRARQERPCTYERRANRRGGAPGLPRRQRVTGGGRSQRCHS